MSKPIIIAFLEGRDDDGKRELFMAELVGAESVKMRGGGYFWFAQERGAYPRHLLNYPTAFKTKEDAIEWLRQKAESGRFRTPLKEFVLN